MAKYSIDSDDSDESTESTGDVCEMCGKETDSLEVAEVAGATLTVCADCSPDSSDSEGTRDEDEGNRTADAIQRASENSATPDSSWAQDADYSDDQLPYLVDDYGEKIEAEREERELTQEELADKVGLGVAMLRVLENEQASRSNIGRSDIESVADFLDVEIIEEV